MKRVFLFLMILALCTSCATMTAPDKQDLALFAVETMAMGLGYDMRGTFEMTPDVKWYFDAIEAGKLDLQGAQVAEAYLSKMTHPIIANRLVALAGMCGFDLDEAGKVVGVDRVNIIYLQAAARGFQFGLDLD